MAVLVRASINLLDPNVELRIVDNSQSQCTENRELEKVITELLPSTVRQRDSSLDCTIPAFRSHITCHIHVCILFQRPSLLAPLFRLSEVRGIHKHRKSKVILYAYCYFLKQGKWAKMSSSSGAEASTTSENNSYCSICMQIWHWGEKNFAILCLQKSSHEK
jgi:hypothetical protein